MGYWWAVDNRNKKVMTLDLHQPKGQEIVRRLVPLVDVVTEKLRPGTLERWHVGSGGSSSRIDPHLVMARITAFRTNGTVAQWPRFCRHRLCLRRHLVHQRPGQPAPVATHASLSRLHNRPVYRLRGIGGVAPSRCRRRGTVDRCCPV